MMCVQVSRERAPPAPYTKEHKEDYALVCLSNDLAYELEQVSHPDEHL
jgi:hypothetical protein